MVKLKLIVLQISKFIKTLLFISVFFLFAVNSNSLIAQGCCSGGTPISNNLNIGIAAARSFSANLSYDYNHLEDLVSGSEELDDKLRRRVNHSILLRSRYAFNERLSVIGLFTWIRQEELNRSVIPGGADFSRRAQGIGDVITLLQYKLWQRNDNTLILAAGLKWPFGDTEIVDPDNGIPYNPDLQPGTGSYDFQGSVYFGRQHFLFQGNQFNFTTSYRKSNEFDRFDGQQQYRFGDELFIDAGISFPTVISTLLFYPELSFRYRFQTVAQTNGANTVNTGGHWLYITPGFRLAITPEWSVFFFSEIPIYRNLKGVQLTTSYRIGTGVQLDLSFADGE